MKGRALGALFLALAAFANSANAEMTVDQYMQLTDIGAVMCETRTCADEERARALRMFKPLHKAAANNPKLQTALEEHYAAVISRLDQLVPSEADTRRVFQDRQEAAKRRVEEAKSKVKLQQDLAQ